MNILPFAIGGLLGGSLLKSIFGGGGSKSTTPTVQPSPLPTATRDDAEASAQKQQELLRRRGGAADMVTGSYGASAPAGGKTTLGS